MFRLANASRFAILALIVALAGCAATNGKPASVAGECNLFRDPKFPVQGRRAKDQQWITKTQETGIQNCGWPRPKPEPEVPTVAETTPALPASEPPKRRRWFGLER
jgi:hypothetical protein